MKKIVLTIIILAICSLCVAVKTGKTAKEEVKKLFSNFDSILVGVEKNGSVPETVDKKCLNNLGGDPAIESVKNCAKEIVMTYTSHFSTYDCYTNAEKRVAIKNAIDAYFATLKSQRSELKSMLTLI